MKLEVLEYLPEVNSKFPPLLFVHGAFHGAWCWKENFLPYFASKGFPSYALSFRGHGESEGLEILHSFSLSDYMNDVLEAMLLLKKPVLIGHSMGGGVVQKILHLYPDKIKAAVLIASVPPNGLLKDVLRLIFTNFRETLQMMLFSKGRRSNFPPNLLFSKELPVEKRDEFLRILQPDSIKAIKECYRPIVPKSLSSKVPILILGSKKDYMISEKSTIFTGSTYKTEPVIFPDLSHDMMLDPNWEAVADRILDFLFEYASESEKRCKDESPKFLPN